MLLQCFSPSCLHVSSIYFPLGAGARGCSGGCPGKAVIWSQAAQNTALGSSCSLHSPHPLVLPPTSESSHLPSPPSFAFAERTLPVSTGQLSFQSYSALRDGMEKWCSSSELWGCRSSLQAAGVTQENLPALSLMVPLHIPSFSYTPGQAEAMSFAPVLFLCDVHLDWVSLLQVFLPVFFPLLLPQCVS